MSNRRTKNDGRSPSNSSGYLTLLRTIYRLPFGSFRNLVVLYLQANGFCSVKALGRLHRQGRRPSAGIDYLARRVADGFDVAVRIRHWRSPIHGWAIDELRGVLLRDGVPIGMLVTNCRFSATAVRMANAYPGRPVQLVGADDLASWIWSSKIVESYRDLPAFSRSLDGIRSGSDLTASPTAARTRSSPRSVPEFGQPSLGGGDNPEHIVFWMVLSIGLLLVYLLHLLLEFLR